MLAESLKLYGTQNFTKLRGTIGLQYNSTNKEEKAKMKINKKLGIT